MKAIRLLEYGGQLVFNDVPTPTIARDEILVKIKSTARRRRVRYQQNGRRVRGVSGCQGGDHRKETIQPLL